MKNHPLKGLIIVYAPLVQAPLAMRMLPLASNLTTSWPALSDIVCEFLTHTLEKVRKGIKKELKPSQSRTLKGDRKILLKRAHAVSDRERLIDYGDLDRCIPAIAGRL